MTMAIAQAVHYGSNRQGKLRQENSIMAFVNEYISDEDIEKYGIEKIWLRHNPVYIGKSKPSGFRFQWTIDRARDIYFMVVGGGGRDEVNVAVCILNWQGKQTEFRLFKPGEGSKSFSESPYRVVWGLGNATTYDPEILLLLKEALTAYGYSGMRRQVPNTIVEFKF